MIKNIHTSLLCTLVAGKEFSLVKYAAKIKGMSEEELRDERIAARTLQHSFLTYNHPEYKKPRLGSIGSSILLNARQGKNLISEQELNSLEKINRIENMITDQLTITRCVNHPCFKLDESETELRFLSVKEVMQELKKNKHASIIYNNGVYDLAPKEGWGGVTKGLIHPKNMELMQDKKWIEQTAYFNHKGRRSYNLVERGAKKVELPSWVKNLPTSYLHACGVKTF